MLAFALVTLVAPTVFSAQSSAAPGHGRQRALNSLGSEFLDGVPGPADPEGVRTERGLWPPARGAGARAVRQLAAGDLDGGDDPRHHRLRGWRSAPPLPCRLPCGGYRTGDEHASDVIVLESCCMAGYRGVCLVPLFKRLQGMVRRPQEVRIRGCSANPPLPASTALFAAQPLGRRRLRMRRKTSRPLLPTIAFEDVCFLIPAGAALP